jgi:protein TonB
MNAVTWVADIDPDDDLHLGRWAFAACLVLAVHAGAIAAYMFVMPAPGITGADVPSLMIDFAPEAAAPETEADLAPGPETIDSQPTLQPEVKEQATEEPVIEIPPVQAPEPDIVIPPKKDVVEEKKEEVPQPKPPEPVEQPVQQQAQSVKQPTSNPKVEKRAEKPVSPEAGTTAARKAMANYASLLSAHLQRFKRPGTGRGTAVVSFTLNRNGQVVGRSIVRSSGSSIVDNEAMAMIARAQPMPPFPAAVQLPQETFIQAIRFR